jgi:AraC-like DNA-binding protein
LLVPSARILLLVPFRNGLQGKKGDKIYTAQENRIAVVGITDTPSQINPLIDGPTGTIGIELSALGAYRFLKIRMNDLRNQLFYLRDLLGKQAMQLEERMEDAGMPEEKAGLLQEFLLNRYLQTDTDPLFEYCIIQINNRQGHLAVRELERITGYSSRWLNMKFEEKLGLSPKMLSSIIRFQQYYQAFITDPIQFFKTKDYYTQYFDESHFIKDFKRFTGLAPTKLIRARNELGKLFFHG